MTEVINNLSNQQQLFNELSNYKIYSISKLIDGCLLQSKYNHIISDESGVELQYIHNNKIITHCTLFDDIFKYNVITINQHKLIEIILENNDKLTISVE